MLRHADPERDGAACAAIYAPHVRGGLASFEEDPPSAEQMAARISAVSRSYPWLVTERGGEAAGYAYAAQHHSRPGYRWAVDVAIYVGDRHHRKGVARELYGALLDLLAKQRIHVACAGIALPNDASVALHESLGFERVALYPAIGFKNGAWLDVGWWQRRLLPPSVPPREPLGPQRL
jgi:L-amino acid N-acyltransferase YncA